jgi:hypothetical protein
MTKVTKGAIAEFVRAKLKTNEKWQLAAMLKIYDLQTEDEKAMGDTCKYNGVGFSGAHGEIMSSLAVQYQRKGWLSPKQKAIVAKIIHKYTRQVIMISDISKLETLVINQ